MRKTLSLLLCLAALLVIAAGASASASYESTVAAIDAMNPPTQVQLYRYDSSFTTKITGICNVSSMVTLLNRRLAYDGLGGSFSPEQVLSSLGCTSIKSQGDRYYYVGDTDYWANSSYSNGRATYRTSSLSGSTVRSRTNKAGLYQYLASLLQEHPEGIVIRNNAAYHNAVIYKYAIENNAVQLYVKDPAGNYSGKLEGSWLYRQAGDKFYDNLDFLVYISSATITSTYTVSYDPNGGTGAPANQTKSHGAALTLSRGTPTRADSSAGSYTVTLDPNGGAVNPASLTAARTTSYTFKNWNTKQNGSGTSYNPGASYTANAAVTLYAQWDSATDTAAVTLPTPNRDNSVFLGWAGSQDASEAQFEADDTLTPTGDLTLYAVWLDLSTFDCVLPTSLLSIDDEAFFGCAFRFVRLPDGVESIGQYAFAESEALEYIYIPESVTDIAPDAFDKAEGLTILGVPGSTAEEFAEARGFTFLAG